MIATVLLFVVGSCSDLIRPPRHTGNVLPVVQTRRLPYTSYFRSQYSTSPHPQRYGRSMLNGTVKQNGITFHVQCMIYFYQYYLQQTQWLFMNPLELSTTQSSKTWFLLAHSSFTPACLPPCARAKIKDSSKKAGDQRDLHGSQCDCTSSYASRLRPVKIASHVSPVCSVPKDCAPSALRKINTQSREQHAHAHTTVWPVRCFTKKHCAYRTELYTHQRQETKSKRTGALERPFCSVHRGCPSRPDCSFWCRRTAANIQLQRR